MLIFSFITWKLVMLLLVLAMYLLPFIVPLIAIGVAQDCGASRWSQTTKGVLAGAGSLLFLIVYLAYIGWIHEPGEYQVPNKIRSKFTQGWDEYVAQDAREEAAAAVTRTNLGIEIKRYKLVAYNPPKHFYVTLQAEDGTVSQSVYVSKHCNNHRQNTIGGEYNLEVMKYTLSSTPGQVHHEFRNLYNAFCS